MSDLYKIYLNSLAAAGRAFEADETPAGVVFRAGLRRPGFARIV